MYVIQIQENNSHDILWYFLHWISAKWFKNFTLIQVAIQMMSLT